MSSDSSGLSIIPERFASALNWQQMISVLMAGLIVGTVIVMVELSVAALVFSGDLKPFLSRGIGFALLGGAVVGIFIALTSSVKGITACPQDTTGAVVALVAASIVQIMPASTPPEQLFNTVMVAIILTTAITGAALFVLGHFRLGDLTRYIPYPVIGGILAGTGWLLVQGGIVVMTDMTLTMADFRHLMEPEMLRLWLPGLIYALAIIFITRIRPHPQVVPTVTILAIVLFMGWIAVSGMSFDEAAAQGFLLGDVGESSSWSAPDFAFFADVDWSIIVGQAGGIITVTLISAIALLLNLASLELVTEQDIDLNHELKVAGLANLASSTLGSFPGYQVLSTTVLAHEMKARSRFTGVVIAALSVIILLAGSSILQYLPKPVLGGLLLYLGLNFLIEWIYDAWYRLPRSDYIIVVMIFLIMATIGFLPGIGAGVLVTIALFVANYSRINVVKYALTGTTHHSNVDRPTYHMRVLNEKGSQLYIMKLHGFIFFGTAHNLLTLIRQRMESAEPIRFLVLDFRLVTGLDTSALMSFLKLQRVAKNHDVTVVYTNLPDSIVTQLRVNGSPEVQIFSDLDHGIEWCENQIIAYEGLPVKEKRQTLEMQLARNMPAHLDMEKLFKYFEREEIDANTYIIRQGDLSNELYFIEEGQVTVHLEMEEGHMIRLRTMGVGTVVGEIGLYLGNPRSASVIADMPTTAYRLTAQSLRQLEHDHADIAAAFHRFMIHILAERLNHTDDAMRLLLQ